MTANAFIGKPTTPTVADLAVALGPAKTVWDELLSDLARKWDVTIHEWKCYSAKSGWALRVKRKSRTILWLSPSENCFTVLFILGNKAVQAMRSSKWPQRVVKALAEAPKYPEGTGLRFQVSSPSSLGMLMKIAAVKLAN